MDARAIIAELDRPDGLPREALAAATAQREEMAPLFIDAIERYIAAAPRQRTHPDALFFMFHLLGEWRETEAYPTLARFLRLPEEELDRILDDAITATSHRVMISVFDGDPEPLYDIILDADAHPFIRSRMCELLATLVAEGQLNRTDVTAFLRACFTSLEPQGPSHVWHGWQNTIAMLGLKELSPLVKEVFRRDYVECQICDFRSFEKNLRHALTMPDVYAWLDGEDHQAFGNTAETFSHWHGFSEAYRQDLERARQAAIQRRGVSPAAAKPPLAGASRRPRSAA